MGFQVSPGVEVKEIDLTNVIPAVSTSIGGYSGYFRWGPVNKIGLVSSEKELAAKFGTPNAEHTQSFLTAASFLKYGSALKTVRAERTGMLNAVENGVGYEVATGGIESVAIATVPEGQVFEQVTGVETLSIVEADGEVAAAGAGAAIDPLYQINVDNSARVAGYQYVDVVNGSTGDIATLVDGQYTATINGNTVEFTVTSGAFVEFTINAYVTDGTTAAEVEVFNSLNESQGFFDFSLAEIVFTISATPSALGEIAEGDYFVATDGEGSINAVVTVTADTDGVTPVYTFNLLPEADQLVVFPAGTTGLITTDNTGNTVDGLFFDLVYDIGAISVTATGANYVIANITVAIDSDGVGVAAPTELEAANFIFDEKEEYLMEPTLIRNEEEFEAVYPPTSNEVLSGLMYSRFPGEVGNSIEVHVVDTVSFDDSPVSGGFDAVPADGSVEGEDPEVHILVVDAGGLITGIAGTELEKWQYLSTVPGATTADGSNNYYIDVVNANSNYVYIAREVAGSATGYTFGGGSDGTADSYEADTINGLNLFDDPELVDVNLLFAQVDQTGSTIANHLGSLAATRKDVVAFLSPPISASTGNDQVNDIKTFSNGVPRGVEGSYGVIDSTALYVYNKYGDNYVWIPASGHIAGLCAKTDDLAEPWFSPAGFNRGSLRGVTKLAFNPKKAERDELYKAGINPIVSFPGQGILLFGDKTAQAKPSAFDRINVRRLFIVLEKAIATAAKYQLFELNDEFTRAMFRNMTEPFLRDVKGRRGVTDFLVVCDETNNTGEIIDTNRFVADIYIKPARSINFITLNFVATRTGVDFSEIVGK